VREKCFFSPPVFLPFLLESLLLNSIDPFMRLKLVFLYCAFNMSLAWDMRAGQKEQPWGHTREPLSLYLSSISSICRHNVVLKKEGKWLCSQQLISSWKESNLFICSVESVPFWLKERSCVLWSLMKHSFRCRFIGKRSVKDSDLLVCLSTLVFSSLFLYSKSVVKVPFYAWVSTDRKASVKNSCDSLSFDIDVTIRSYVWYEEWQREKKSRRISLGKRKICH
jgi:hypothetical protein